VSRSIPVTFTTRRNSVRSVHIGNICLPEQDAKYLGLHLDTCSRTQIRHIQTLGKIRFLLERKSELSTSNKILTHKAILTLIRACGIQLWGAASTSNRNPSARMIVDTPRNVTNTVIRTDLQTPTIKKEIHARPLNTVRTSVHTQTT
jgi:hypothetical protein